ncbi:MAG: type II secretion system protein [Patescibacteria group bacterium]
MKDKNIFQKYLRVICHISRVQKGFTIGELIVVLAIAAMILSFIFINFREARISSRNTKRVQNISGIQNALALFHVSNSYYPGTVGTNGSAVTLLNELVLLGYIPIIENDPLGAVWGEYYYCPGDNSGGTQAYVVRTKLEQEKGNNPAILSSDIDGAPYGCDCSDTSQYYCVGQ